MTIKCELCGEEVYIQEVHNSSCDALIENKRIAAEHWDRKEKIIDAIIFFTYNGNLSDKEFREKVKEILK